MAAAAADAIIDIVAVNAIVRQAVEAINVVDNNNNVEGGQTLEIRSVHFINIVIIGRHDAQYIVNFLQRHPHAVTALYFCYCDMTRQAVEIFATYFANNNNRNTSSSSSSLRHVRLREVNLGNENGARLVSGLHGNTSITQLDLSSVELKGAHGGAIISTLLQNNSSLRVLFCHDHSLGVHGARALKPGLGANQTLQDLVLVQCQLGDEGLCLVVDALIENGKNSSIRFLNLGGNRITASGLPHVTRLLLQQQQQRDDDNDDDSLTAIVLNNNPGLFHNQENTQLFSTALSQCTTMNVMYMNLCQLPLSAIMALFQASVINKKLKDLYVYDHVQLQGHDLERLLAIIPTVNLVSLHINLDFMDEHVISSFHRNMTIQHLHSGEQGEEIMAPVPVFDSLERNRLLHDVVRRAVEAINVNEDEQELKIRCADLIVDEVNARHITDSLRLHPRAVNSLDVACDEFTTEAVEIFRAFLVQSTLQKMHFQGKLGNGNDARLLSGLHGNPSIKMLILYEIGLEGHIGGDILSDLLQNNSTLTALICGKLSLGVEGARALQRGIRTNQTLCRLGLQECRLGDAGLSVIADTILEGNNSITNLSLYNNRITASGLPHVTRLIQGSESSSSSFRVIDLDNNPGIFDNQENTRLFFSALQSTTVKRLRTNSCRLSGHALTALFDAAANLPTLISLRLFDRTPLQGMDLEPVLNIIPQIQNLQSLHVNLDFTNESVLSAFHRNTSIIYLYGGVDGDEPVQVADVNGRVLDIVKRNDLLCGADELLNSEPQKMIPLGLWANAIASITNDKTGATAAYKILCEKLVLWWTPAVSTLFTTTAVSSSSSDKKLANNEEPEPKRPRLL